MTPTLRSSWQVRRDTVRFVLRSRRDIPTSKGGHPDIKQVIRTQFHEQLRNLWDWTPRLKAIRGNGLPLGEAKSRGIYLEPKYANERFYGGHLRSRPNLNFYPLVTYRCGWECRLDIRFLIRQDRIDTVDPTIGDIEKRIPILLDALRIPQEDTHIVGDLNQLEQSFNPYYCLLEDDSLIASLSAETLPLLNTPRDPDIEPDMDEVVHVGVMLTPRLNEFSEWMRS